MLKVFATKTDFSDDERKHLASTGAAMSDGSYPIRNAEDMKHAISLAGMSKTHSEAEVKAHIKSRAKALGIEGSLPDSWASKADWKAFEGKGGDGKCANGDCDKKATWVNLKNNKGMCDDHGPSKKEEVTSVEDMTKKMELGLPKRTDPFSSTTYSPISYEKQVVGNIRKQYHTAEKSEYVGYYGAKRVPTKSCKTENEAVVEMAKLHYAATKQEVAKNEPLNYGAILKGETTDSMDSMQYGLANQLQVPPKILPDALAILRSPGRDRGGNTAGAFDPQNSIS